MALPTVGNRDTRNRLDQIYARKKEHAIRRCSERCELRYKDYKRMVRDRQATVVLKETNSRRWYAFTEPSGATVYGLWSEGRDIFFTFLTEEMFANRLRLEDGEHGAYRRGAHFPAA